MAIQIEKSFSIRAPVAVVWGFLTDPYKVAACLPGAAITGKLDEQTYGGTITVKVGPVTASYRGKMHFAKLDDAAKEAEIVASGQETRGKGGADMKMKSRVGGLPDGSTGVTVVSDVNVVGALAQFGRGMIQDVSDQLFQKFTEAMRRELETTPTTETTATAQGTAPAGGGAPTPTSPGENVLDVGSLGAAAAGRAALRTLRRPVFWIIVIVIAILLYWFLRSQS